MIAGCGGGGVDAKDYVAQAESATCDYETRCGLIADTASCLAYQAMNSDATFLAEVNMGLVDYSPDKAEECFNDIRNTPCDATSMDARQRPAACTQVISGPGLAGDSCVSDEECQSTACSKAQAAGPCDSGSCVNATPLGKLGEPCATRNCESGLVCDNTKTCAMLFTEGMACMTSDQCNYGLACDAFPTGFCRNAPKIGEACPDHLCAEIGAYCSTDGTCTALGLTGAACTTSLECAPAYPCNTMTGTCEPNPTVGQPCTSQCSDGSFCDFTSKICTAKLADGAACTSSGNCQSYNCDTTMTHTCVEPNSCF
jgi:hypothetical protein